jgi:uncharacterized protein YycO
MMKKILLSISLITLLFSGYWMFEMSAFAQGVIADSKKYHAPLITQIQEGDIIFQSSTSGQSLAIQLATHSKYSHVGIIYKINGEWMVYEAVQPVKTTPLNKWITYGDFNHYVIKRLKNAATALTPETLKKMKTVGQKFKGKNYDLYFEWSNERIYCSELVWKIYKEGAGIEIGKLQKLSEFDLTSPEVKKKLKERYGNNIPMNEKIISPGAMFDSELLVEVVRK